MDNYQFIPSVLQTKASASLEAEVAKELQINDPEKSIAQILQDNEEKKDTQNQTDQDENTKE